MFVTMWSNSRYKNNCSFLSLELLDAADQKPIILLRHLFEKYNLLMIWRNETELLNRQIRQALKKVQQMCHLKRKQKKNHFYKIPFEIKTFKLIFEKKLPQRLLRNSSMIFCLEFFVKFLRAHQRNANQTIRSYCMAKFLGIVLESLLLDCLLPK